MNFPDEALWARVEKLADEMSRLPPERLSERVSQLAANGEAPTVITLLGTWLSLPPPPAMLAPGTLLGGRYVLREKLGEGGMGSVWRASQELIAREVAVKMIHPSLVTPAFNARFAGEMKVLGQLNHPGIVKIFDAGVHPQSDGTLIPFFAMELIEGQPLDAWATPRRRQQTEILRVMGAICSALGHAHEREIVHRDLKPRNVLLRPNGQPVIVDFGIARLRGLVLGEEEGAFSGTPQYAAPEQHLGRDHDFRSGKSVDIYALGAMMFEVLSARKLFEFARGASIAEMRRTVLESPVPRLSDVVPDCPSALEEVISRAVRRDPADRFYSIATLGRAIERVAASIASPQTAPPSWMPGAGIAVPGTSWILTEKLGEGGAGEVWVGMHKQLGERRVFKFCDTEEKARTLKREVTLFRLLKERVGRNPHFIQLHEVSLDEPPFYLMMDYVDARDLEGWCASHPGGLAALPESTRLEIIIQAAEALQAAHDAGILHRDIKPANLLVRNDTPALHVFIADFGIGQIVTDQLLRDVTRLGFTHTVSNLRADRLSGTLLYLAPEVLEGNPATARSDIYSLGVVLWQLMAGNLHAALDPSDWSVRIEDPILRDVLRRCLAGAPEKRWASAGELAATLHALPQRRALEERRRAEAALRERDAYRRGMLRTATVAAAIVMVVALLALLAFTKRREAENARGEIALEQAATLSRSDFAAGRKAKGTNLLEVAARTATNLPALRSAAASVFGLTDLLLLSADGAFRPTPSLLSQVPRQSNELGRVLSPNGTMLAIARDLDGLNGAIDFVDPASRMLRFTVTRKEFPWMPVAESDMLQFSPDNKLLAIAGTATSRHVLLLNTTNGTLRAYIFHGSDPISMAWHPDGSILATGCADGAIRIWDIKTAVSPKLNAQATNQFDLPPNLDAPALDFPLHILKGQRDRVRYLVFAPDGHWLAALDNAGYLRIFSGFGSAHRLPSEHLETPAKNEFSNALLGDPVLAVETNLENAPQVSRISALKESVLIERANGRRERLQLVFGQLPDDLYIAPDLASLAWSGDGTELCFITLTDVHWAHSSPLELFFSAPGKNPNAVSWDHQNWLLPAGDRLDLFQVRSNQGALRLERKLTTNLVEAVKGQGAQTSLASAADGRGAVYRGRRIQFFANSSSAPPDSSIIANGGDGAFQGIVWDAPGRLLGVFFLSQSDNLLHLESWKTSADFPPRCEALPAASLECERLVPANNGRDLTARGTQHGLFLFDPTSTGRKMLDNSSEARQNAPLACSDNGAFLAMIVDRSTIRLLRLPSGKHFADLHSPRISGITHVQWDHSGSRLATLTEDGYVQVWNLSPWQSWLAAHHLE